MTGMFAKCKAGHYFLGDCCSYCGQPAVQYYHYMEGDCINCGNLCPEYAYGCNERSPLGV